MTENQTLTGVPGVEVGHWTDKDAYTGVTVMTFPEPNVAAVEVRGAAPGTREIGLLGPGQRIEAIQALVFAGGSAFGLSTADGVVQGLESDGRGHETAGGKVRVPIVPAAILFDYSAVAGNRPGAAAGEAAYRSASPQPVAQGSVGAGTGATVAKWRGFEHAQSGGVGSALREADGAAVGALVVVNAIGDVFALEGTPLTGGSAEPGIHPMPGPPTEENTTLIAVATDAALTRTELMRLTVRAQDALAACIRPGHTRYDGDIAFAVSCGAVKADHDALGEAAFVATADAIVSAIRNAGPMPEFPWDAERPA